MIKLLHQLGIMSEEEEEDADTSKGISESNGVIQGALLSQKK